MAEIADWLFQPGHVARGDCRSSENFGEPNFMERRFNPDGPSSRMSGGGHTIVN